MQTRLTLMLALLSIGFMASCAGFTSPKDTLPPSGPATQTITLSPATITVRAGAAQQFTAVVTGVTNPEITWLVNGLQNGNSSVGLIASTGGLAAQYTAPSQIPSPGSVTVTATVSSASSLSSTATLTVGIRCRSSLPFLPLSWELALSQSRLREVDLSLARPRISVPLSCRRRSSPPRSSPQREQLRVRNQATCRSMLRTRTLDLPRPHP